MPQIRVWCVQKIVISSKQQQKSKSKMLEKVFQMSEYTAVPGGGKTGWKYTGNCS
jgi:hypothetical protein